MQLFGVCNIPEWLYFVLLLLLSVMNAFQLFPVLLQLCPQLGFKLSISPELISVPVIITSVVGLRKKEDRDQPDWQCYSVMTPILDLKYDCKVSLKPQKLTCACLWAIRQSSSRRAITVSCSALFSCCQLMGGLEDDLSRWSRRVELSSEWCCVWLNEKAFKSEAWGWVEEVARRWDKVRIRQLSWYTFFNRPCRKMEKETE